VTAWYRDGVRFSCQRCGNCCSGKGSVVQVSAREREAIARRLSMSVAEFEARHTRTVFDDVVLRDAGDSGDCEWLERRADGTSACRIQDVKPDQCAGYPFWPRVLASRAAWEREGAKCRGIGQGDAIPAEEVERRGGREAADADLDLVLAELDYEVADLGARCWLSGDCCDFDGARHRLYVSAMEAQRLARGVDLAAWDPASRTCPAWKGRRCTAREHRPLACRTYFCDPRFRDRVQELTERYTTRLKWLHERHRLAWDYADLRDHLGRLRASIPGVLTGENDR
jgi:Fe-S-cluster containining protein